MSIVITIVFIGASNYDNDIIITFGQVISNSPAVENIHHSIMKNNSGVFNNTFYVESTESTNMRVLSIDPFPVVEVTYIGNSSIGGSPTQTIGTIIDSMADDGLVHSNGQAIVLTGDGQVLTYKTESVGHYKPDGSFYDKGMILFRFPHPSFNIQPEKTEVNFNGTLYKEFNNLLGFYEKTVDPSGIGYTKVWKWSG
jgi:hypothetical protein